MKKIYYLLVAGVLLSCVSKGDPPKASIAPLKVGVAVPKDCEQLDQNCSSSEKMRVFCKAYHDKGISSVWAQNSCLGYQSIYEDTCKLGISPANIGHVKCIPDPSQGECPYANKLCTYELKPSRCRATGYDGRPLNLKFQLLGAGSNPCTARQALMNEACQAGLVPSKLESISCEGDYTGGECPPVYSCSHQKHSQFECSVKQYGKRPLTPAWTVEAPSECDARYQLKIRACRFADANNKLKPSLLGEITCKERSL